MQNNKQMQHSQDFNVDDLEASEENQTAEKVEFPTLPEQNQSLMPPGNVQEALQFATKN